MPNPSVAAVEFSHISKRYSGTEAYALKDVTLQVMPGEVYGFLGANGAGKTTAIRVLLNFLQPTDGTAAVRGLDVVRDSLKVKRHIGYLAGDVALYMKTTGRDLFAYLQALQPLKNRKYYESLVTKFEAEMDKPVRALSKGNRQKLGIIQALMHEPEVLILDEPTGGLDPVMQDVFYQTIIERKRAGTAIFMSSHNLTEVQHMCDRIGFIRAGQLVAEHTIADLANGAAHTFDIVFKGRVPVAELKRIPQAKVAQELGTDSQAVTVELRGNLSMFFGVLARHEVLQIDQREVNLAREFLELYGKDAA